jgi:hypothetical protein
MSQTAGGHDHGSGDGHGHSHDHDHEENPWAGQGTSVLLDIGGDIGALVVTTPQELVGTEVEIRPRGVTTAGPQHHPHVAVVLRPMGARLVPSLVYPELLEGDYELYVKGTDLVELRVSVDGGKVTEAEWPTGSG